MGSLILKSETADAVGVNPDSTKKKPGSGFEKEKNRIRKPAAGGPFKVKEVAGLSLTALCHMMFSLIVIGGSVRSCSQQRGLVKNGDYDLWVPKGSQASEVVRIPGWPCIFRGPPGTMHPPPHFRGSEMGAPVHEELTIRQIIMN